MVFCAARGKKLDLVWVFLVGWVFWLVGWLAGCVGGFGLVGLFGVFSVQAVFIT